MVRKKIRGIEGLKEGNERKWPGNGDVYKVRATRGKKYRKKGRMTEGEGKKERERKKEEKKKGKQE